MENLVASGENVLSVVETDKAIKMSFSPKVKYIVSQAEKVNQDFDVIGYGDLALDPREAQEALVAINVNTRNPDPQFIASRIGEAMLVSSTRNGDSGDMDRKTVLYTRAFMKWAADIVYEVLGHMHKLDGGWFPSLDRVERELEMYGNGRKALVKALEKASK